MQIKCFVSVYYFSNHVISKLKMFIDMDDYNNSNSNSNNDPSEGDSPGKKI